MRNVAIAAGLILSAVCLVQTQARPVMAQESTADLFARIKPSLGLVVTTKSLGTAFCIHSTPTASYYITNAHVVGSEQEVTVFRQFPSVRKLAGLVVARGLDEDPDLAVIKVAFGNVPALSLNTGDLREGDPIAIAGYPSAQYTFAEITGSLLPAVHSGTISAIANRGGVIEYDAQTLPGNSGGPLFDQRTGAVDGIVQAKLKGTTDANIAIGVARVIAPFLNKNGVSFTRSAMSAGGSSESASVQDPDPSTLRALPGADMVAVIYDDSRATGQNTGNYIAEAAADFAVKLGRAFNVQTVVVDAPTPDAQTVGSVARANSALIGVPYGVAFHGLGSYTNAFGTTSKWTFSLSAALIDSFGVSWVSSGRVEKTVTSARDVQSAITSSLADLNDQAVAGLQKWFQARNDDSVATNLFRYAIAMPNGGKRALFNLKPSDRGATAVVPGFGPAFEAGLQTGDEVLTMNGVPTAGMTQEQLSAALLTASAAGPYDLVIETADGKSQHITFESKPMSWLLAHRPSP